MKKSCPFSLVRLSGSVLLIEILSRLNLTGFQLDFDWDLGVKLESLKLKRGEVKAHSL